MKFFRNMNRKKTFLLIALPSGIAISLLGGGKLVIYIAFLISGLLIGRAYSSLRRAYDDYRLALKVNTILYGQKQTEEIIKERDELRAQVAAMNERIKLYRASQAQTVSIPKMIHGDDVDDDQHSNGTTRIW